MLALRPCAGRADRGHGNPSLGDQKITGILAFWLGS